MAANFGAHEVMEIHETLSNSINVINQMHLLREYVQNQELRQIIENHLQFAIKEYNNMVETLRQQGMNEAIPYQRQHNIDAKYGLQNPSKQSPHSSANQINDRDVASILLGLHKASATMRMSSALECVDPELRYNIQQGANNCAEQAYEIWQFMNSKGYYQVPTMKEMTTQTMMNSYGQAPVGSGQYKQEFIRQGMENSYQQM